MEEDLRKPSHISYKEYQKKLLAEYGLLNENKVNK